jgi:glycine cleavage system H protein
MTKWKTMRIKQELVTAAKRSIEKSHYKSLSDFVSDAIRLRLDELQQSHEIVAQKQAEYPLIHERLLYTPDHIWTMVTPEGNVSVGLSNYAQEHLKGTVGIQTHPVGYTVKKGEPFGVVETWMFLFDLYSPVSGQISKINKPLQDDPHIINKDPQEIVWIAEIKPNNLVTLEEELRDLIGAAQYKTLILKTGRPQILGI